MNCKIIEVLEFVEGGTKKRRMPAFVATGRNAWNLSRKSCLRPVLRSLKTAIHAALFDVPVYKVKL